MPLDGSSSRPELISMLALAAPSALMNCLRMAQMLTDQAVIGHLSHAGRSTAVYLDAAALALLWMTLTLSTVNRGITGSVNTLVSRRGSAVRWGSSNHRPLSSSNSSSGASA